MKTGSIFDKRSKKNKLAALDSMINGALHKKRYKTQQRQIKGLNDLNEITPSMLSGIKISRLNNLGAQEENQGNKLARITKIEIDEDRRRSSN